jgi:hypothetical protein
MAYLTILFALIAAVGGGISWQANKALPGDPLYQYKVSVNEEIERQLARSDEAAVSWDIALLKERIDDAEALADQGKLDARAQTDVTDSITEIVKNLTAVVDKLEANGHAKLAADTMTILYNTLSQETQQVSSMNAQAAAGEQLALAPVLVKLRTTLNTVGLISTQVQARANNISTPPKSGVTTAAAERF